MSMQPRLAHGKTEMNTHPWHRQKSSQNSIAYHLLFSICLTYPKGQSGSKKPIIEHLETGDFRKCLVSWDGFSETLKIAEILWLTFMGKQKYYRLYVLWASRLIPAKKDFLSRSETFYLWQMLYRSNSENRKQRSRIAFPNWKSRIFWFFKQQRFSPKKCEGCP